MSAVKKFFVEFKSIFTGEDVLKENEIHANIIVATIMFNIFILAVLIYIMTAMGIFNVNQPLMLDVVLRSIFTLFIPSIIAFILRGKGKYLKFILLIFLTLSIGSIYSLLTYTATLLLIIPVLLAARYYSKNFTIFVAVITVVMLGVVEFLGIHIGLLDLNYVELPKGTKLTIETNISDAVKDLDLNKHEIEKYIMLNSYLPKLFIYCFIIAFACVQISQSGRNMIERQKELSEEGTRIESELNIANAIQKNMLPSIFPAFPEHKEIDIYAEMKPAKEVGGDFYDMFLIDENHLAFLIADVSGKGVPAALIMMITKTLIKNTALNGYSVDEVFYKVNNLLCEKNALNHFVTSWFGMFDLRTGKLEFVNAGHNPPLIYTKKENIFEYYKTKPNLILAAMENTKYQKHELTLEPGDKIFLYTDGVTEATSDNDELYGEKRLKDYLNSNIDQNIETIIKGVKKDIDNFIGKAEQFDDITMLEFLFKEKKGEGK
ncbi:Serine phosphatase RsbU, regulator of sigma subunit [Lachnospiraceae bacterium RM5]|nr:Serine phosphatase RsbU, regulator of sigma subunit [Lachnospiraceae bacterium RM5]